MTSYLAIAGLALLDLWLAMPAALTLKLQPELAALLIASTSSLGVVLAIYFSGALRTRFAAKFGKESYLGGRTAKYMDKYGTTGIGLLAPVVLGPILTCICAIALGAKPRQLALSTVTGVVLWSFVIYLLLAFDVIKSAAV
ncbi:MAG: hypothetical protein V4631_04465 [Pseudomonadota bacterium]